MTQEMDHDRCSELLRAYARDDLAAPERQAIESHLSSCADCRTELGAVRVLLGDDSESLTGRERRKLHAAVAREVAAMGPDGEARQAAPRRSWGQRFAPTLAATALLLVAVGVALTGGEGSDELGEGTQRSAPAARDGGAVSEESFEAGGGGDAGSAPVKSKTEDRSKPESPTEDAETTEATEGGERLAGGAGVPRPRPRFKNAFVTDLSQMTTGVFDAYTASYTVADARKRADGFLMRLSAEAPADVRVQVRTCGRAAVDAAEDPLLPAAGALGRIEEEPSLLLSFAYTRNQTGPLDSYMVWAWPRGSCSARLDYATGPIKD